VHRGDGFTLSTKVRTEIREKGTGPIKAGHLTNLKGQEPTWSQKGGGRGIKRGKQEKRGFQAVQTGRMSQQGLLKPATKGSVPGPKWIGNHPPGAKEKPRQIEVRNVRVMTRGGGGVPCQIPSARTGRAEKESQLTEELEKKGQREVTAGGKATKIKKVRKTFIPYPLRKMTPGVFWGTGVAGKKGPEGEQAAKAGAGRGGPKRTGVLCGVQWKPSGKKE